MSRTDYRRPPRTRPATEVLYARLPADLIEWIRQQAGRSGMSMAAAAGMMLAYCREAGLTLEPPARPPLLVLPNGAASSPLARPPGG